LIAECNQTCVYFDFNFYTSRFHVRLQECRIGLSFALACRNQQNQQPHALGTKALPEVPEDEWKADIREDLYIDRLVVHLPIELKGDQVANGVRVKNAAAR